MNYKIGICNSGGEKSGGENAAGGKRLWAGGDEEEAEGPGEGEAKSTPEDTDGGQMCRYLLYWYFKWAPVALDQQMLIRNHCKSQSWRVQPWGRAASPPASVWLGGLLLLSPHALAVWCQVSQSSEFSSAGPTAAATRRPQPAPAERLQEGELSCCTVATTRPACHHSSQGGGGGGGGGAFKWSAGAWHGSAEGLKL